MPLLNEGAESLCTDTHGIIELILFYSFIQPDNQKFSRKQQQNNPSLYDCAECGRTVQNWSACTIQRKERKTKEKWHFKQKKS